MKWFEGSIPEAVATSKAKKAIFVVFVEGEDDVSKQVAETLNSTEVSSKLESEKFVSVKLASGSENYTFFVQIYQLVPVPSIFFIGENGTPLDVIGNPLSSIALAEKIDSISSKSSPQAKHSSANLIDAEQNAHSSSSSQQSNKLQDKVNTEPSTSNVSQTSTNLTSNDSATSSTATTTEQSQPEISHEEKVRRARELIELQSKKKQEEEDRKEREREVERRRMGRDVQKMKQQQQDKLIREAHEERIKEKTADAAARQKILKQIEEDKLERKKRYEKHQQEKAAEQKKVEDETRARAQAAVGASRDMTKTRIQFKLPTGNNINGTFDSTGTLSGLRTYVLQNAQLPFQHFSMSSFFPRRDFTSDDDNKTLLDLELVPSSVILILPAKSSNPVSVIKSADGGGIFSHFLWTLLAPVVSIYNFVMGYFTGRPRGGDNDNRNENRNPESSSIAGSATAAFARMANMGPRRLGGTSKIRARGNIHTLHSGDDDNDENNTWNGNSTQQM